MSAFGDFEDLIEEHAPSRNSNFAGDNDDDDQFPAPQMDPQIITDDLTAICNSLGKIDKSDGTYMMDRDCKPCLKEILRMLSKDTDKHNIRMTLGALNIIKSDLIPIANQYCTVEEGDSEMFTTILRICNNLTSSVLFFFKDQKYPSDPEEQKIFYKLSQMSTRFKEAFACDEQIWSVINGYLKSSMEEDEITFERLLILIRNILLIPNESTSTKVVEESDAHDLCLQRLSKSGLLNTFLKIATDSSRGAEFCLHITEIVHLMLKDLNPETIANSKERAAVRQKDDSNFDKRRYAELSAMARRQREASKIVAMPQRFRNTSYVVQNCRSLSNAPLVVRKPIVSREMIKFDQGKVDQRKNKNQRPLTSNTSMYNSDKNIKSSRVSWELKVFCMKFIEQVYRNYMHQLKHSLIIKQAKDDDESYYLWCLQFFICFAKHMRLETDQIAETVNASTLHFVMMLINQYQEVLKMERKSFQEISKRMHLAVRAFREILRYIKITKDQLVMKMIVEEIEYKMLILNLFEQFQENKHSEHYLADLIIANQDFLEVIESYKDYDASLFVSRYCNSNVISAHIRILRQFKTNSDSINAAITKLFNRIVYDCKSELVLCQASLFQIFLQLIDYKAISPTLERLRSIGIHVIKYFASLANKKRFMYQELLFWKSLDDMHEIDSVINPPDPAELARDTGDNADDDDLITSTQKLRAELAAFESTNNGDNNDDTGMNVDRDEAYDAYGLPVDSDFSDDELFLADIGKKTASDDSSIIAQVLSKILREIEREENFARLVDSDESY